MSAEIRRAVEILSEPGGVVELRAFRGRAVESGYFDEAQTLSRAATKLDERGFAVYVTANPANPALLSRAANSDGKPIYCYTMSGTANADVIRAISEDTLDSVGDWYGTIVRDLKPIERVVRLLTSSLQTEGDALRAFLHAWTALEILINKTFKRYETQFFSELSEGDHPEARLQYLERIRDVMGNKYRMTDKFALIAALLSPADADEDVSQFKQAKKARDNLTHGQDVAEATLPISMVQSLVRKYIRLHLDS